MSIPYHPAQVGRKEGLCCMRRRHLVWKWRLNGREGAPTKVRVYSLTFKAEKRHPHLHAIEYQTDACDCHRGDYHRLFTGWFSQETGTSINLEGRIFAPSRPPCATVLGQCRAKVQVRLLPNTWQFTSLIGYAPALALRSSTGLRSMVPSSRLVKEVRSLSSLQESM